MQSARHQPCGEVRSFTIAQLVHQEMSQRSAGSAISEHVHMQVCQVCLRNAHLLAFPERTHDKPCVLSVKPGSCTEEL